MNNELNKLPTTGESEREINIIEARLEAINRDLDKIDSHLKEEIDRSLKVTEENVRAYVSKLVKVRKSHLEIQREQWKRHAG